jgi:hypothetical protein
VISLPTTASAEYNRPHKLAICIKIDEFGKLMCMIGKTLKHHKNADALGCRGLLASFRRVFFSPTFKPHFLTSPNNGDCFRRFSDTTDEIALHRVSPGRTLLLRLFCIQAFQDMFCICGICMFSGNQILRVFRLIWIRHEGLF